jgi:hypothetical protein
MAAVVLKKQKVDWKESYIYKFVLDFLFKNAKGSKHIVNAIYFTHILWLIL